MKGMRGKKLVLGSRCKVVQNNISFIFLLEETETFKFYKFEITEMEKPIGTSNSVSP